MRQNTQGFDRAMKAGALRPIDWHNPDYQSIIRARLENLERLAADPEGFKAYYRQNGETLADFISDWGWTFEPRNPEVGRPALIPFILFPKQRESVIWVYDHWRQRRPGLIEKSRDMGVSWLAVSMAVALCVLYDGVSIGFGSRKAEYVDKLGEMKSLLPKARIFAANLPPQLRAGYVEWRDAPLMRLMFPDTGSTIGGEGGDDIGRGDRRSLYFVDEFAHFERPDLVDMALSQTTNCRIDMSSVRGMNNAFARRRWGGRVDVLIFDWRDDPRKDEFWYQSLSMPVNETLERPDGTKIFGKGLDDVTIAQEVDRDYGASVHGIVIPAAWARAALGAREKLGLALAGERRLSLDVADEGKDKNALLLAHGIEILSVDERSGKGADIFKTVEWTFDVADEEKIGLVEYDADGLGAGVRGDARTINERRHGKGMQPVSFVGFRGSEAVVDPDGIVEGTMGREGDRGRTNKDMFGNRKAQGWWELRRLFRNTYRWVVEGRSCAPDDIISINPKGKNAMKLVSELSQPTYSTNPAGKIIINKVPGGMPSPNLADAAMIRYAPKGPAPFVVPKSALLAAIRAPKRKLY